MAALLLIRNLNGDVRIHSTEINSVGAPRTNKFHLLFNETLF